MTSSASGSAPPQRPSQAEAASSRTSGRRGEALLAGIGNTPLLPLDALIRDLPDAQPAKAQFPNVHLLGKAEWYNPGGSVKDRAAARIVAEARRSGELDPGRILIDPTSGNTGIADSMLGAALGFRVTPCLPENAPTDLTRIR